MRFHFSLFIIFEGVSIIVLVSFLVIIFRILSGFFLFIIIEAVQGFFIVEGTSFGSL